MRISVVGATGMAGRPIVAEALDRGHIVTAWSRRGGAFPHHERLTAGVVHLGAARSIETVLDAIDAAVLTVRPAAGHEHLLASWTTHVLDAAATTGTRVLVVGGAAPLTSPHHPDLLVADDPEYVPAEWRMSALASVDQLRACRRHPYRRWVYLSPPAVFRPGPTTGSYERGTTRLLVDATGASEIAPADLAIAVVDELENPSRDPHVTVVRSSSAREATTPMRGAANENEAQTPTPDEPRSTA